MMDIMQKITLRAPAKINLYLNITGKRADGYHDMQMIMQAVDFYDTVTVSLKQSQGISISAIGGNIPCDETNIAYRCAFAMLNFINRQDIGVNIHIEKNIPMQAGLGGGSADGAAVLTALNTLLHADLSLDVLIQIGKNIGADIPFCLVGAAALVEGIGDKITPVNSIPPCSLIIIKPAFGISTKDAFAKFDSMESAALLCKIDNMLKALKEQSLTGVSNNLDNILETCCCDERIAQVKQALLDHDAMSALMSGSGSAVFGIFENDKKAEFALRALDKNLGKAYLCHPLAHGPVIL